MQKFVYVLLLTLFISSVSFSQQTRKEKKAAEKARVEAEKKKKREEKERKKAEKKARGGVPENIQTFPKNFLFKPKVIFPAVIFNVTSRQKQGENFNWKPSIPGS